MNNKTERYFFDQKAKVIYKESIISRKKISDLNEEEVLELIESENAQICIHSEQNKLDWIEKHEINELLNKIKNHVNNWENQKDFSDFENGYCYFAELWKMKYGEKLILLYYRY